MLSLVGTLAVLCTTIGLGNYRATVDRADKAIALLYQYGGEFPMPEEPVDPVAKGGFQVTLVTPFETRYFIVTLTARQEVESVDTGHIAALDRQTVLESVNRVLASGADHGYIDYYRFGVF